MKESARESLQLDAVVEHWPLRVPFRITGYTITQASVLVATVSRDGCVGRGEAAGVYYLGDDVAKMAAQIESFRSGIREPLTRTTLQRLLPPGGARNAVDCALWDLESQLTGEPVWRLAGLDAPKPLITTFTCGAADPESMAATALEHAPARAIKLKLTGDPVDHERVRAVRAARPDVWLGVDANQGFTRDSLRQLMPTLEDANVQLIEQPFPRGREAWLDGVRSTIPIAADESVQSAAEIVSLRGVHVINIKLDKCGGLTEALQMVRRARDLGLDAMVGCMPSTSLSMAPAFLVGQLCRIVDLDGPIFLRSDRLPAMSYRDGTVTSPPALWGSPRTVACEASKRP